MSKEVTVVKGRIRQQFSDEEKKRLISEFKNSGMSLNAFAKSRGIAPPNLSVWNRKFENMSDEVQDSTESRALEIAHTHTQTLTQEIYDALKTENQVLKQQIASVRHAYGQKLVEIEMARMGQTS